MIEYSTSIEDNLRAEFEALITKLDGNHRAIKKWTEGLIASYSEPQRRYHILTHIYSMLQCMAVSLPLIKNANAIKLFIFFHDWVYDPKRHDNELQSVSIFKDFAAEVNIAEDLQAIVDHYIKATITHTLEATDEIDHDLKLCLDFDLEVLGREIAEYTLYSSQIREEYSYFSDQEYASGRVAVLRTFLDRERLFFTDSFYNDFEQRARKNLQTEIELLGDTWLDT